MASWHVVWNMFGSDYTYESEWRSIKYNSRGCGELWLRISVAAAGRKFSMRLRLKPNSRSQRANLLQYHDHTQVEGLNYDPGVTSKLSFTPDSYNQQYYVCHPNKIISRCVKNSSIVFASDRTKITLEIFIVAKCQHSWCKYRRGKIFRSREIYTSKLREWN